MFLKIFESSLNIFVIFMLNVHSKTSPRLLPSSFILNIFIIYTLNLNTEWACHIHYGPKYKRNFVSVIYCVTNLWKHNHFMISTKGSKLCVFCALTFIYPCQIKMVAADVCDEVRSLPTTGFLKHTMVKRTWSCMYICDSCALDGTVQWARQPSIAPGQPDSWISVMYPVLISGKP